VIDRIRKAFTRTPDSLPLRLHATLEPVQPGDELVDVSVGPAGELVTIWAAADAIDALEARRTSAGGASFPEDLLEQPVALRIVRYGPAPQLLAAIPDYWRTWPTAQPMPGGNVLVVATRVEWSESGVRPNATVYDAAGQVVGEKLFGDGIENLRTTSSGQIWVGYFDEGVYGNLGWGSPGGPSPVGAAGLVRFGPELERTWAFSGAEPIDDCYAVNVVGETLWACYYIDFPVVRIEGDEVRSWSTPGDSVSALAVAEERVALVVDRSRVVVGRLGDTEVEVEREYSLTLPDGAQVFGWGPELHVVAGREWYRLEVPGFS
jgi:hypothetical protein